MPHPNHVNPRTGHRHGWDAEQARKKAEGPEAIEQQLAMLERLKVAGEARDDLLVFTKFTTPDPAAPNDVHRSKYEAARFHEKITEVFN